MNSALLDQTLRFCRRNLLRHPQYDHFIHWSFLVFRNEVLAHGVNRKHEPHKNLGYHAKVVGWPPKWHSELDAISRCWRMRNGIEVVNVRLNKRGETRMACPCRPCVGILRLFKVKKVLFTTDVGWSELRL